MTGPICIVCGSGPTLLYVGRLHPEKGVFDLLDAFVEVRQQVSAARLVLIGVGPARADLVRRIDECGWSDRVSLYGTVKNRDLSSFFRSATVFCSPSITTRKWAEQVGMTNLQAMACGLPVVSTRSGAIPEYVPEAAGILVPERSPQALAEAILGLLADPERRQRLGEVGRAYVLEHYDAGQNVARMEDLILSLARRD